MIGEFVIVRTYSAGVHVGTLLESSGTAVLPGQSSRIWRWRGANTLDELSLYGADEGHTRISEPVARKMLTEAIEIIPCTEKAKANLGRPRWPA